MYKRIGIIAAMSEERDAIFKYLTDTHVAFQKAGLTFEEGAYGDLKVMVVTAGIGKVNAALCTQIAIDFWNPDVMLNVGVAGGLDERLSIGDIVISVDALHHDIDCSGVGNPPGEVPRMAKSIFPADPELIKMAEAVAAELEIMAITGRVVSGDQFISTQEKKDYLKAQFNGSCAEMEGCAMAHVCFVNEIPYLIIRSISDNANDDSPMTYEEFMPLAAENAGRLMKGMFDKIKEA